MTECQWLMTAVVASVFYALGVIVGYYLRSQNERTKEAR